MTITSVVLRRRVDDLGAAVAFYEELTGEPAARFAFAGLELASTGPFLLFTGPDGIAERFAAVSATLTVADLDAVVAAGEAAGAEVIGAPADTPNGRRAVLRHPDGAVYEYVGV
ncbi:MULTISPECIES: VOC family protein [unclassified Streptomyces]|uniref:VOC family protein n=1 Tax=unclassified Streptomyces TaxID=2593676 RepID=UPI00225942A4|nr:MULTISPECIES: VOC family protein [unclassified Streptomyces]MCX4526006.1 VOC family protein [Streptomyces sp. NBC_01551]MCX4543430.1 VOC family protein [Streptomyces sp. NBC_01565]